MKNILCIIAAAALLCGCNKPTETPLLQKWEYKIVEVENFAHSMQGYYESEAKTNLNESVTGMALENEDIGEFNLDQPPGNSTDLGQYGMSINVLGQEGWELVSAIPQTETTHPINHDEIIASVRTGKIIFIFKRPIEP
ncbi:MAG: hypothetical protein ABR955_13975 [Verrucomicrobiota bacterium]|jgi:hypothetical protein